MDIKLTAQPNMHSEIYRSLAPKLDVTVLEKYLDFVEVSSDGHVLLGSSNLTGRAWYGSVWYYENITLASKLNSYVANRLMQCGVAGGRFLPDDSSRVLVVDDSGSVQLLSLPDTGDVPDDQLQVQLLAEEHEGGITELSLSPSGKQFLTASMDCSIKLWDVEITRPESNEYFDAVRTFSNAHKDIVTSVCSHLSNASLFVSCGSDREALLWDTRIEERPALAIYENAFCGLTDIKWHPQHEHLIAVAAESGVVYLVDLRDPYQFLTKLECFGRSVYRVRFNSAGLLAVCADTNAVLVLDTADANGMQVVYRDERHTDMVRGLSWASDSTLITCGWDRQIHTHQLVLKQD